MSIFWFELMADVCPNHFISRDVPEEVAGRGDPRPAARDVPARVRGPRLPLRLGLEGVPPVRRRSAASSCPTGSRSRRSSPSRSSPRRPRPRSATTTRTSTSSAPSRSSATASSRRRCATRRSSSTARRRARGGARDHPRRHQVRVRLASAGAEIVLADEVLTPDSSRFWPADEYEAGRAQRSFDKQYVRDYLDRRAGTTRRRRRTCPTTSSPHTRDRYVEAYERITEPRLLARRNARRVNLFIQGMRRSGTTILYDALLADPELRCFYEPLREQDVTEGGGSGAREGDAFAETRALRERVPARALSRTSRSRSSTGAGRASPPLEIETRLPEHCPGAPSLPARAWRPPSRSRRPASTASSADVAELAPDAALVHVVRDPRAVAASIIIGPATQAAPEALVARRDLQRADRPQALVQPRDLPGDRWTATARRRRGAERRRAHPARLEARLRAHLRGRPAPLRRPLPAAAQRGPARRHAGGARLALPRARPRDPVGGPRVGRGRKVTGAEDGLRGRRAARGGELFDRLDLRAGARGRRIRRARLGAPAEASATLSPVKARVLIRPKDGILDPQGKAVERALPALGFERHQRRPRRAGWSSSRSTTRARSASSARSSWRTRWSRTTRSRWSTRPRRPRTRSGGGDRCSASSSFPAAATSATRLPPASASATRGWSGTRRPTSPTSTPWWCPAASPTATTCAPARSRGSRRRWRPWRSFAAAGGPVLGICNGFQVLCEAGLLPGALLPNEGLRFVCRQVDLTVESATRRLRGRALARATALSIPVKHACGRYFAPPERGRRARRPRPGRPPLRAGPQPERLRRRHRRGHQRGRQRPGPDAPPRARGRRAHRLRRRPAALRRRAAAPRRPRPAHAA